MRLARQVARAAEPARALPTDTVVLPGLLDLTAEAADAAGTLLDRARARVAARLAWLGAELDPDANEAGSRRISTAASRVQLLVIPTDEESIIAQEAVSEEAAT